MLGWIKKSIAAQFIAPMIVLTVLIVAAGGTIGVKRQWDAGVAALQERVDVLAKVSAGGLIEPMWNLDYANVTALLNPLAADPVFLGATVVDDKAVQRGAEGMMPPAGTDGVLTAKNENPKGRQRDR